jgi:hypothetical protein
MKNRKMVLDSVPESKDKKTEEAEKKKCIEYFR